ncbi:hypothetical protein LCGC14_2705170 [marine sediment metagenome]|uniref:Uncharacterized protein n=1 Tax=marine sediment metagenome TaxID=412755 RepID=A0A0F8ZEF9_9ZZZZ
MKSSNAPRNKKNIDINKKIDELHEFLTINEIAKEGFTSRLYIIKYLYETGKITENVRDRHLGDNWYYWKSASKWKKPK